jgi:long-chain acyl-CoA synthetase
MTRSLVNWSYSDRPALITEATNYVSYAQLRADVTDLAEYLPPRQLVFLSGRNDQSTITFYLACLEARAVPLLLDADLSEEALRRLVSVYQPKYLYLPKKVSAILDAFEVIRPMPDYDICIDRAAKGYVLHKDLALLLATSGSTGYPKLVRLSLNNIVSNAKSIVEYLDINLHDRAIASLPFHYSYGMSVLNSHLHAGASIVLANRSFFDPVFWRQMREHEVTSMAGVPYSYEILLKLRFDQMDLPALRTLTQAGGKLPTLQAKRVFEICRSKNIRFFTMYGQTEASPRIAYLDPNDMQAKLGSIGRAIPGGDLWVEDERGQIINQPNQTGELIYSGPNVALGYAESVEDLSRGDDWRGVLRTGDFARKDEDGFFYIEGRKNRFLKVFGVRISLDAIETWFADRNIVVAAHGHDDYLQVTIESDNFEVGVKEASAVMAAMRIHPSAMSISTVPVLPRSSSGKVDYQWLNTKH